MPGPLLFLDVDGVINCPGMHVSRSVKHVTGEGLPITVPHDTARRVQRLEQAFDCVWCTAWMGHAAPAFTELLGLTDLWPFLPWDDYKLPAILAAVNGRPFAFVDDDADWEIRRTAITVPANALIINCDRSTGLNDDEVNRLLTFAAAHQNSGPQPPVGRPSATAARVTRDPRLDAMFQDE